MEQEAPEGAIWFCRACGKTAKTNYGKGSDPRGWDVSCAVNSILVRADSIQRDGAHVIYVQPWPEPQEAT